VKVLDTQFFEQEVLIVAKSLIGFLFTVNGVGGVIVETEAYRSDDAASHSFRGKTVRNSAMFGLAGHAYVYRSYGLHWCFNIVCGNASAVLLRAIEPKHGINTMMQRRKTTDIALLCSGPGRLSQALAIDASLNGLNVLTAPFDITRGAKAEIVIGERVGISRAKDYPWRFGMKDSPYFSRKF
jgi:DNA-3-methyladenine glycosylase